MKPKAIMRMRNKRKLSSLNETKTWPIFRVGLYVDMPNLYAVMKNKGSIPNLDRLMVVSQSLGDLIFAKCYTTMHTDYYNHSIIGLERIGFTVIPRFVPNTDYGIKKDIDTFLVVDAVVDLLVNKLDILIIASNDSDFLPVMKLARKIGKVSIAMVSSHDEAKLLSESATVYLEGIWCKPKANNIENNETEIQKVEEVVP
jgi:uncharacterized LabA/DUF88 family protein